jgi:transcriptional regulator with XRE-family HTH domain
MATRSERSTLADMTEAGGPQGDQGAHFRARRLKLGLSVQALAKRAHIDRDTLKRVEDGRDGVRELTLSAIDRALSELEQEIGMDDPDPESSVVRFTVRGVYGAEAIVVEGPVANIADLEASVDRIMRRLNQQPE